MRTKNYTTGSYVAATAVLVAALCASSASVMAGNELSTSSRSAAPETIAYVGCSNTWMSVEGYHNVGGNAFWPANNVYGGGTAITWASNMGPSSPYWNAFDSMNKDRTGTKSLWFQVCVSSRESYQDSLTAAMSVIAEAKKRVPGATVYVSGLSVYVPPDFCTISGDSGVSVSKEVAAQLVRSGFALAGPVTAPLSQDHTIDSCHPDPEARLYIGRDLVDFFK